MNLINVIYILTKTNANAQWLRGPIDCFGKISQKVFVFACACGDQMWRYFYIWISDGLTRAFGLVLAYCCGISLFGLVAGAASNSYLETMMVLKTLRSHRSEFGVVCANPVPKFMDANESQSKNKATGQQRAACMEPQIPSAVSSGHFRGAEIFRTLED